MVVLEKSGTTFLVKFHDVGESKARKTCARRRRKTCACHRRETFPRHRRTTEFAPTTGL